MQKRSWFDSITRDSHRPSQLARTFLYALGFGLVCAFTLTLFTGSYNGTCYGFVFGALFGTMFAAISRFIARQIGEGGILWNGFAGVMSGALSGAFAKMICAPFAHKVLSAVYGRIDTPVQLAFYAVVCAAYLGGFFGLFQGLMFGRSVSTQETDNESFKPDFIGEEQTARLSETNPKRLSEPIAAKRED